MRYLFALLVLFTVACQNDLTDPSVKEPNGMAPAAAPQAAYTTLDCRQAFSVGSVVLVDMPASITFPANQSGTITAAVYRDHSTMAGVQIHCRDYVVTVSWKHLSFIQGFWTLTPLTAQSVRVKLNAGSSGWVNVIGTVGAKSDTTRANAI
jgi:hypothetical protein